MARIDGDAVDGEDARDLLDDDAAGGLDAVGAHEGGDIVGVDAVEVEGVVAKGPGAGQVDALGRAQGLGRALGGRCDESADDPGHLADDGELADLFEHADEQDLALREIELSGQQRSRYRPHAHPASARPIGARRRRWRRR